MVTKSSQSRAPVLEKKSLLSEFGVCPAWLLDFMETIIDFVSNDGKAVYTPER